MFSTQLKKKKKKRKTNKLPGKRKSKEQNKRKRVKEVGMLGHAMADRRVVVRPSGQDVGYRGDFSHRMLRFHLPTSPTHTHTHTHTAYGVCTPDHPVVTFIPDHVTCTNLHSVLFLTHSRRRPVNVWKCIETFKAYLRNIVEAISLEIL